MLDSRKTGTPAFPILSAENTQGTVQHCPLLETHKDLGLWVDCCWHRFFSLARQITGNSADAEDALQESCVKILRAANIRVTGPTACSWAGAVVGNTARDIRRARHRRSEDPSELDELQAPGQNPEASAHNRKLIDMLKAAVRSLPDKCHDVFAAREILGHSTRETADLLDVSPSVVTTRLGRARRMIQARVETRLKPRRH